jgi:hypothetical protein
MAGGSEGVIYPEPHRWLTHLPEVTATQALSPVVKKLSTKG